MSLKSENIRGSKLDSEAPPAFATLVELLRWRALHQSERPAYTFLANGEEEEASLTYGELDCKARAIGALLQEQKACNERVLLVYPPGLEYITAFLGCLYAGAVAVPIYPPRSNGNMRRLQSIVGDAKATMALTTASALSRFRFLLDRIPAIEELRWLTTDLCDDRLAGDWRPPDMAGESIAFLQYTSGSTGTAKGVIISHGNLIHNASQLERTFKYEPDSRCVSWLPVYHDMGLIGSVLQPMYGGFPSILMSPVSFLQRPVRWLQAISRYKATISGGPDFAYQLCARRVSAEQRAELDLSTWAIAFTGSEPIRAETIERFAASFGPHGFRRESFFPCYGLAEATLLVSGGKPPTFMELSSKSLEKNRVLPVSPSERDSRPIVGCGAIAPGHKVAIVNSETSSRLSPDQVGEIWVSSPSVAQGYWNRPEETRQAFKSYLSDTGEGPFLRTGDKGFLVGEELFVTGRIKDLIIIRGVNHYPQHIEATAERCNPAARPGAAAAFSVEARGQERLVIVQEVNLHALDAEEAIASIRKAVSEEHEIQLFAVALIKTGGISKTSSGKIQRHACRAAFLGGTLEPVAQWRASELTEDGDLALLPAPLSRSKESLRHWLAALLAARLGFDHDRIDSDLPIIQYGIDSLAAIELVHHIETGLGVRLKMASFLQGATASELAAELASALKSLPSVSQEVSDADESESIDSHRLSPGQQALWFLHELSPQSAAYNIATALRIRSEIDVGIFRQAFQRLVDRHACLRTSFGLHEGEPVQRVHPNMEVRFNHENAVDWSEESFNQALSEEAHRPFDLGQAPLMRVSLFTRSPLEHVLLLCVHHIVADFWSLAVMTWELGILYGAQKKSARADLAPLPLQYVDFARRQWRALATPGGERLWSYWQKRLAGGSPKLNLPTDRPRQPVQSYRGAAHLFHVPARINSRLKIVAQREQATLYMILLAAFKVLLSKYTFQEDISVGSLTSGRNSAALAGLVGYFVNPVVLRGDLSGDPTFEEFLGRTRGVVLSAFEHQDYPFAQLVERLQPERDPSLSPLFQVMFAMQKTPFLGEEGLASLALGKAGARFHLGELAVESVALERLVAPFDLTLVMAEAEGGIAASLQYNTDLFDAETASRMAGHFQALLEGIVGDPRSRISELPILTDTERRRLLVECNDTLRAYPRNSCIHQLFEDQAARTPDQAAVVFEGRQLSYRELNRRANHLAHYLRGLGAGPEVVVGICMERSPEMIVGLLGILKAGAAYLPLDPHYPKARLGFMLEDAGVPLIVTQERLAPDLSVVGARIICLDSDWEKIAREEEGNPVGGATAENLAYVIYTSGSTGAPKGVMIAHRNVVNFFTGMDESIGCGETDALLAATSISFDISVLELFWTLTRGARVILLSERAATGMASQPRPAETKQMQFSLFYFATDDSGSTQDKYRLLLEGAKFADRNGFEAVWTPERHFHEFGGLYPNPAVTGAALATMTERVKIRAGSVVLPLHNPVHVAEEWALVDNLSKGRVAVAFASGWHADDFAFSPERYAARKDVMFEGIKTIQSLWQGDAVIARNGVGKEIEVKIFPRPVQAKLPVWITAAGSPETFVKAGEIGANILTHLLGQSVEEVAGNVRLYRESLARSGHDPRAGHITLMLHTFIGEDREAVREKVRAPFINYLRSSIGLIATLVKSLGLSLDLSNMGRQDMDGLLDFAFNRYFETSALFGTPKTCERMVSNLKEIGVDEVACLVDFGVETDSALAALHQLNELKELSNARRVVSDHTLFTEAKRHNATLLQCTPSMMRVLMLDPGVADSLGGLRSLMLGGEALPVSLVKEVGEKLPARLFNMYGPTETAIWSAVHEVKEFGVAIPIGRPVANTRIYVLNDRLQPLPVGVVGQIYIGGAGVGRGYFDLPALTAEKIIPDPFAGEPGARMYSTGDLGRFLPDGSVEFLGRVDQQVKVRGFRIELEEIEAVLGEHESVREAVVVTREDAPGDVRIVAYIVAKELAAVSVGELRSVAKGKLPEYMVPSAFVLLDALPLTPNGKVDRKALPRPDGSHANREADFIAPRSEIERHISRVWQQALGVEKIGVHDNFFDLGGHSLLMVQVHNQLKETLRRDLPLVKLLEHTTISALAKYLAREEPQQLSARDDQVRAARQKEGLLRQKRRMIQSKQ
ncbi:MAG TPA: MupA/Atu3671 family FMN-dependent luciferase-like monooxygenase [Blastocatellia bacterium]|nr:MupA/Atu3671 family FMN-dependent luciferase-like monooxygenase [Blastocatellia bacterium]